MRIVIAVLAVATVGCRPQTMPQHPDVAVPRVDSRFGNDIPNSMRPEQELLLEGRRVPDVHRSDERTEVWAPSADLPRRMKH